MRSELFTNGEYYHIYNRGVDRRITFQSEEDLYRFLETLRVFNTSQDVNEPISFNRRCLRTYLPEYQLVKINQFTLMPNHFHLLVQQTKEGGISEFMHRLGTSFTQYINKKEGRTGHLFESRFKAKRINSQTYLEHLTRYIHLNPLNLIGIDWKTNGITDKLQAIDFLKTYQWSSFYYYFNNIDIPLLDPSLLRHLFDSIVDHQQFLLDYQPTQTVHKIHFP
ncbi:transposase [Candidatus Uhrbacteria bacterium]|nr:transposase [Candidatus Uhrbacteria bacterium]